MVIAACSSSSNGDGGSSAAQPAAVTCAAPGGATSGPADNHCGDMKQATDLASCESDASASGDDASDGASGDDAAGDDAADLVTDGGPTGDCEPDEFGATMYGQSGADDDCKYDVAWTSTDICEGGNGVYFTVTAKKRIDGTPLTGAAPYIEAVQSCMYPVANPTPPAITMTTEGPAGTYKIGPIVFNRPGGWVVRFHFYGSCADALETSPHGHAAFFVTVP